MKKNKKSIFTYNEKEYYVRDITNALKQAGIKKRDSVFVHSDIKSFGKINNKINREEFLEAFIEALKKTVGKGGNIMMPTFSYSFCKKEIFDPKTTSSTIGVLTEYFRKLKRVKRSIDPIFSVAALGPDKNYFTDVGTNCFGEKSIFEKLYDKNVKIVFLGENFSITYIHFVEQRCGVPYRFIKKFKGKIKLGNKLKEFVFDYNVRPLDKNIDYNLEGIANFLENNGALKKATLGNSKIRAVNAVDAFNELKKGLKNNVYLLLKENLIYNLIKKLFPICRSITGDGVRETLKIIQEHIPIKIHEVPTGTKVFDWEVPKEWNIRNAYVKDSKGNKIVDFKKCNLHVVGYSVPIRKKMSLSELKPHLFTLPDKPDSIPYVTSYYKENWGFCLPHSVFKLLKEDTYEVVIDSDLKNGHLTYGELYIPGKIKDEILFSTYICHPSIANDNLSGPAVLSFLAEFIMKLPRKYSYRFLFVPETIGAIAWLSKNEKKLTKIKGGLVATCLGDQGQMTFKRSKIGNTFIDHVVEKVLVDSGQKHSIVNFFPLGSDERQFCSLGFNLPVGSLVRTLYGHFSEYHTSDDNLDFVKPEFLADSLERYKEIVFVLESNATYKNMNPKCEPRLGKRNLYADISNFSNSQTETGKIEKAMLWILSFSDSRNSLLDIAIRANMPFILVKKAADLLLGSKLIRAVSQCFDVF